MRIGIDIRCLVEGRRTGVEEYTINLLENIFKHDQRNKYFLFLNSFKEPAIDLDKFRHFENVEVKRFRVPNKILNFCFWYLKWPKIDKMIGGVDVFFLPNITFCAFSKKVKTVITAHDLSYEYHPETFSWKRRLWHLFVNPRKIFERADKIIAVSKSTGNDLQEYYGIDKNKVTVIHSAVSENLGPVDRNNPKLLEIKDKYDLPYKFVLSLGTIEPRKNVISVIRAFDYLKKNRVPGAEKLKLVIAGTHGWKDNRIFSEINASACKEDIKFIGYVEEDDKKYLYNLASVFVYVSLFEGFGFPPLEAMRCGTPVICSNNTSLPEIVGPAAIMVDPSKVDEIFLALKSIICEPDLREDLRKKGIARAGQFSWRMTAVKTIEVITDKIAYPNNI